MKNKDVALILYALCFLLVDFAMIAKEDMFML
jgi:hypothetical protein